MMSLPPPESDNGVVGEIVGGEDKRGLQFGFLHAGIKDMYCVKE